MIYKMALYLALTLMFCFMFEGSNGDFSKEFDITWGNDHVNIFNNGRSLTLSLDEASGSGFRSKNQYMFGKIDMQIKLVPGNSAGTIATFYMSSKEGNQDEIDFEFLGNLSGEPYTIHTNVYVQGEGNREQQFHLWFDPTLDFHTYSILWNPLTIVFYVDGTPIREYKNLESKGIPYPKSQPMWVYSSLWDAEDWATRGGLVKTDWAQAPFIASYTNYNALQSCIWSPHSKSSSCSSTSWLNHGLDEIGQKRIKWVQNNFMIYDYCNDFRRFSQGFPPECSMN
ncbi:hypothetical protein RND81_06G191200 [Saponaria officinalis]|uniref:Xyloglucan endotransglucosylase/hydrolase n=1 Tax=Saponaria officinalis TaxID=3572 RepID=A0AAW1KDE4_SAPOF